VIGQGEPQVGAALQRLAEVALSDPDLDQPTRAEVLETIEDLAEAAEAAPEERAQLLPSGRATVLYSRVQWARAYLKQAGLVEGPARGVVRITEEGCRLLAENPPSMGLPLLMRYPSFVAFLHRKRSTDSGINPIAVRSRRRRLKRWQECQVSGRWMDPTPLACSTGFL
jgi:restriction endonuclease Mrr